MSLVTTLEPETAIPLNMSQSKGERSGKSSYFDEFNMSDPVDIDRKYLSSSCSGFTLNKMNVIPAKAEIQFFRLFSKVDTR